MKRKKSIWALVALSLIAVGLLTVFSVFAAVGFDVNRIDAQYFDRETVFLNDYEIKQIEINTTFCDVRILPLAEGEVASLHTPYGESINHHVTLQNGVLSVNIVDARDWYEQISFFGHGDADGGIELRLPQGLYEKLKIVTASGDVSVQGKRDDTDLLQFQAVWVESTSGNIDFHADVLRSVTNDGKTVFGGCYFQSTSGDIAVRAGANGAPINVHNGSGDTVVHDCTVVQLSLQSTSGDITVTNVDGAKGAVRAESTSGDIGLTDVKADGLTTLNTSGDTLLCRVAVTQSLRMTTTSGDVEILQSDAASLSLRSGSGDITALLLSSKRFFVDTTSGDVAHPESDYEHGGLCEINTTSGDVDITVLELTTAQ